MRKRINSLILVFVLFSLGLSAQTSYIENKKQFPGDPHFMVGGAIFDGEPVLATNLCVFLKYMHGNAIILHEIAGRTILQFRTDIGVPVYTFKDESKFKVMASFPMPHVHFDRNLESYDRPVYFPVSVHWHKPNSKFYAFLAVDIPFKTPEARTMVQLQATFSISDILRKN